MKIEIVIEGGRLRVRRLTSHPGSAKAELLLESDIDPRFAERAAALVAQIVGIAVAEAIAAAGGE